MLQRTDPPSTLADVLHLIDQAELTSIQRRDMVSAIKRLCDMVARTPSSLRVDVPALREMISDIRPAALDITDKTFSNIRSLVTLALEHAGVVEPMGRGGAKRHPAWAPLMNAIAGDKRVSHGLAAFANRNAVAEFVAFLGLSSPDQLYGLAQAHVIAWREELIRQGASARTIANRLSALSSLYKHLCEKQLCAENPVAGVKRPKVTAQTVETAALSAAQVRTMLDAPNTDTVQGLRDRALLHVFFYTGCRVSEPCVLRVRDFHQDQGYWVVDFTVKGGKRNRVAVSVECQLALADYLEAAGHGDDRNGYLFRPVKNGRGPKPMDRSQLHQLFQKYARLAGVPQGVTPHSARATFITEALQHDHPAEAVQRTVGHASVTTTLAYDKRDHHPRKSASFAVRY